MTNTEILIDHAEYCETLKKEYYTRCIKMLYNWSTTDENTIIKHVNALGLFDYTHAITWLLTNKSKLNSEIMFLLGDLTKCTDFNGYHEILDRLKVALIVCNKSQSIKILTAVTLNADDPKHAINYLDTF